MKIEHLTVKNFRRVADFDKPLAPFSMFLGANDVGKSTLLKAISFCLTSERLDAGKGKDNAGLLLTKGAEAGTVTVRCDGQDIARDVLSGKALGKEPTVPLALPYLLRTDQLALLPPGELRTMLFNVMGVSTSAAEIERRVLEKEGVDKDQFAAVKHLIGPGLFAPALTEAERKRVADKGAWCEVTGHRQYGAKIAAEWKAEAPGYSQQEWDEIQQDLVAWTNIIAEQNQLIGEFNAYQRDLQRVAELREAGRSHAALTDQLNTVRKQLAAAKAELEAIPEPGAAAHEPTPQASLLGMGGAETAPPAAQARGQTTQQVMTCPECQAKLVYKTGGLVKHAPPAAPAEPEAAPTPKRRSKAGAEPAPAGEPAQAPAVDANKERRETLTRDVTELGRQFTALEAKVLAADRAIAQADEIEAKEVRPEVAAAPAKLKDAEEGLAECRAADREIQQRKAATDAAGARTRRAGALHAAIQRWDALVEALGPDGVQKDLLDAALGPLDQKLAEQAEITGWPRVRLDPDAGVFCGDHPHRMLGESMGWRANAMLAVALAIVSGLKLVLLDRFDCLNLQGGERSNATSWLYGLVLDGILDTVIIAATMKAPPKLPEEQTSVIWVGGEIIA